MSFLYDVIRTLLPTLHVTCTLISSTWFTCRPTNLRNGKLWVMCVKYRQYMSQNPTHGGSILHLLINVYNRLQRIKCYYTERQNKRPHGRRRIGLCFCLGTGIFLVYAIPTYIRLMISVQVIKTNFCKERFS